MLDLMINQINARRCDVILSILYLKCSFELNLHSEAHCRCSNSHRIITRLQIDVQLMRNLTRCSPTHQLGIGSNYNWNIKTCYCVRTNFEWLLGLTGSLLWYFWTTFWFSLIVRQITTKQMQIITGWLLMARLSLWEAWVHSNRTVPF